MNTKTFAQQARRILLKGVADKLRYWGFDEKGKVTDMPDAVSGGFMFRGEVFDDPSLLSRWESLRKAMLTKGREVVLEEAAYTWFNRIMAIRILAKNGYDMPQLEYAGAEQHEPLILQRARRGTFPFLNDQEQARLRKIVADFTRETESFAILLIGYCHSHPLLSRVFGGIDDYTELLLPDNILAKEGFLHLLNTVDAISDEQYREVELIGWLYQYYISEKKDEVFASFKKNKKAEAKDIPAATQIFTPNWIVKYMVENTVGKLWLDLHPDSPIKADLKYLVEGENPEYGNPIISEVADLKLLDPACGSGHILVEGFDLLYKMYLAEYYTPEEAVESILQRNLFGLDIDKRAVQLAQFAVLLKAARYYRDVLRQGWLPNIYAMPDPRDFSRQEVLDFLGKEGLQYEEALSEALALMQQAQNLGSIMQFDLPEKAVDFIAGRWEYLQSATSLGFNEQAVLSALGGYIPVLLTLCGKYEAVVANPPYMNSGSFNDGLKKYVSRYFSMSKWDLMTVFVSQIDFFLMKYGLMGVITLQSWLYLSSFRELRGFLIKDRFFQSLLQIGYNTFPELNSKVAQGTAIVIEKRKKDESLGLFFQLNDVSQASNKEDVFLRKKAKNEYFEVNQKNFLKLPSSPIAFWVSHKLMEKFNNKKFEQYCTLFQGIITGDNNSFVRDWFEIPTCDINFHLNDIKEFDIYNGKWVPYNKGGITRKWYGNQEKVVNFSQKGRNFTRGKHKFAEFFFKPSFSWSYISSVGIDTRYFQNGFIWDVSGSSAFPFQDEDIYFFMSLVCSKVGSKILEILNPTLCFQVENIASIPVEYPSKETKEIVIEYTKECVAISREDWDSYEVSWNFENSFLLQNASLEEAFKLNQIDTTQNFFKLHSNEEELNRIFIEIYGLQDELTPEVPLKDITILQEEIDSKELEALEPVFREKGPDAIELPIKRDVVMKQFISYAVGVFMGRYRLDKPGLHIAHPDPAPEEIRPYTYNGHRVVIDEDAIIPLMGSGCEFPDDAVHRFKEFLDVIWGEETRTENLNFLQECLKMDLEKYMVNHFWADHCRRYKKKPIYWLFSSPGGAFQVLVYMHRMNAFTVEKIRSNYLIPHLKHLRGKIARMEANTSGLSAQEGRQLDRLRKELLECEQYDIQLKDVADRQINFDLDDGVTVNYGLFEEVVREIK